MILGDRNESSQEKFRRSWKFRNHSDWQSKGMVRAACRALIRIMRGDML
jgi:hypothetical protein